MQVGDRQVYITGSGPKCVVWCHDVKGFNAEDRTRQLVDKLSETTGWAVILPDFIGEVKVTIQHFKRLEVELKHDSDLTLTFTRLGPVPELDNRCVSGCQG